MLSSDILLNTFHHYLQTSWRFWHTLTLVCRRWRQIVLRSPLSLSLRLYCTYGTPVLKNLGCWPSLPLVVDYGGFPKLKPPSRKDDDNIIAALKQSGRVSSIRLTVTRSLLEKLSAISEPFSEVDGLYLMSEDNVPLTLPSTFRWGPRLCTLHSTRIAFPSFPQLLLPSHDLVDLRLHEIPSAGYFSPEAFANALSGMTQLRALSLHFLSLPSRRNYVGLPPQSGERVVLPSLTHLKYRGTSKYLDSLVARIDAPCLGIIDITFFSQPTMDASQLGRFIDRIEMQTLLNQANIQTSVGAVSIAFTNPNGSTPFRLQISCKQLDWQLSAMAQVCDQFSPFLFRVKSLVMSTTQSSSGPDDVDREHWPELIRGFGGAEGFRVAGKHVPNILCALRPADGNHTTGTTVLPALRNLHVEKPITMHGPAWDAVGSFITSRFLSGRPVELTLPLYKCHICRARFEQHELKRHLASIHAYQLLCSYCGDFECTLGHISPFREHLRSKHPEVAQNDSLISESLISFFELDDLAIRHSSPHTPDFVSPFTSATEDPTVKPQVLCHICNIDFTQSQELTEHLVSIHAYRFLCSYCGDFKFTLERISSFRKHLRNKHSRYDPVLSSSVMTSIELYSFAFRHGSLCPPGVVTESTMLMAS